MRAESKPGHVRVLVSQVRPAPENDEIYSSLTTSDPDMIELIASVRKRGVIEPIHISTDGYIISGHRRRFAARIAGANEVPAIIHPVSYANERNEFLRLLVECNTQRKKTVAMQLREEIVKVDGRAAVQQIKNERKEADAVRRTELEHCEIVPDDIGRRDNISKNKIPFLDAAIRVLNEQNAYWPLSVRQVHYRLLNNPPLRHAKKPDSIYRNDKRSYKDLTDILARGRLQGLVPFSSIDDETRPEEINRGFSNPAHFFKQEIEKFLKGYWRHRQQSQPHHIEIIAEKLTVRTILSKVANEYGIPLTINRGMSGPTVKAKIVQRFRRSRKNKLILLVVSDLDPAGDTIAEDIRKAFERDFGITNIEAYKAALTIDQVEEFQLEPSMEAKESSPTYDKYCDRYGVTDAWELEALDPADLAEILESVIESAMDLGAYNAELDAEEKDSITIVGLKNTVLNLLKHIDLEGAN